MDAPDRSGWYPPEPGAPVAVSPDPSGTTRSPRRSRIGTGVAVAAIGIGALGVVGTAHAATSTPSPSPSGSGNTPGYGATGPAPGQAPGRPGGIGWGMGGPGARIHDGIGGVGIHGSFVTPKQSGGYQTVDTQDGTVTGVSSTSITVKSVDGFTQSYVVDATTLVDAQRDGIGSVKTGDEVSVVATVSDSTRSAIRIEDRTQVGGMKGRFGPPDGRHPAWPNGQGGNGTGATGQSGPTGAGTPSSSGTA